MIGDSALQSITGMSFCSRTFLPMSGCETLVSKGPSGLEHGSSEKFWLNTSSEIIIKKHDEVIFLIFHKNMDNDFALSLLYATSMVRLAEIVAASSGPGSPTPSDAHPVIVWCHVVCRVAVGLIVI